jgi:hypothetical protein
MPIIGILLDVYICDEASGEELSDSFLWRDCHVTCWQGAHAIYVALAFVGLASYLPLAVYMRPAWQQY